MLRLACTPSGRVQLLADAAGFRELEFVQNGQGLTPEIAGGFPAASSLRVIAKVIKNRRLCTSAPDVTSELKGPMVMLRSLGKVAR
jgi:hypothetical protein